jgi:hypothetical protein
VVYETDVGSVADFALVVCGCSVKCIADVECHGRYGKMIVSDLTDFKALADIFEKIIVLTEKE